MIINGSIKRFELIKEKFLGTIDAPPPKNSSVSYFCDVHVVSEWGRGGEVVLVRPHIMSRNAVLSES